MTTALPSVTIVTVYYNRADFVRQSLQSLLDQTYGNIRIIAVDDNSTDNTLAVMQTMATDRLEIRSQANKGFTRTVRDTLADLTTDYIAIHGSGDISYPERIARQVAAMQANPAAPFCATASRDYDPSRDVEVGIERHAGPTVTREHLMVAPPFTHGCVMYRTSAYHQAGGYNTAFKFCQDWDLWLTMLDGAEGAYVPEILYDRLNHGDGATFNPEKSIQQLRYKAAVLAVAALPAEQRPAMRQQISEHGIDAAIAGQRAALAQDIARRSIKLGLLGRAAEAAKLRDYLAREHAGDISGVMRAAMLVSGIAARLRLPVRPVMSSARAAMNFLGR